jgi:uncharacterized protein with HEPN domain
MPSRDWKLRLQDILDAIAKIRRYTAGMDFSSFASDDKTVDAVVRNLQVIGEASRHVPTEQRERHSHVPWEAM